MKPLTITVLILSACTTERSPIVTVHLWAEEQWTPTDVQRAQDLGSVWSDLGLAWEITTSPDWSANRCPRHWYEGDAQDCTIDLFVERAPLAADGVLGWSNRENYSIQIDSQIHDYLLLGVLAHEVGHQVFNSSRHVDGPAIMAPRSGTWAPTEADLNLACETIGRGC